MNLADRSIAVARVNSEPQGRATRLDDGCLRLHQLFEKQATQTPHRIAISADGEQLTYRELNCFAEQLAHHLRGLGIEGGARVAVCMHRSAHLAGALLGILKAGAAYVPLDPTYPADRLAYMLSDASPAAVVTERELVGALPAQSPRTICVDDRVDWRLPPDQTQPIPSSAGLAYVMYTSGSTGLPKGVMISHSAIVNNIEWMRAEFAIDENDRVLQKTELSFDPSVWEIFLPLAVGGQIVMPRQGLHQNPDYVVDLIARERVTVLNCVPSFLSLLLENQRFKACGSLRHVFCGGEAMRPDLARRFHAVHAARLHNMYGPTEAAITSLWYAVPRDEHGEIPIGRPVTNTQAYVLGPNKQPAAIGMAGELYLGGAQLAEGYLNRPDQTAERFVRHRFDGSRVERLYQTGDRVRLLSDGNIEFVGRVDQQIKFRSMRIEPAEIELALHSHPGVRDAVVMLKEDAAGDARLVAYVINKDGLSTRPSELRGHLKGKVPAHMMPCSFVLLDRFPLGPNGKLDRGSLPTPLAEGVPPAQGANSAHTPTERTLTSLWGAVLHHEPIGISDNFFELGGHSLMAVRLSSTISKKFGVSISVSDIFAMPTIEQLATFIDASSRTPSQFPTILRLKEGTSPSPLYFIGTTPGLFQLAQQIDGEQPIFGIDVRWPAAWRTALETSNSSGLPTMEQLAQPFVSTILARAQTAPCVLLGYSFAGLMAFEIAHQLEKHGGKVALLILLDASPKQPPTAWVKWRRKWARRQSTRQFLAAAGAALGRRSGASAIVCDDGVMVPWHLAVQLFDTAQRSYYPQRIGAAGVLFLADDDLDEEAGARAGGWGPLHGGGFETIVAPGDHHSILQDQRHARSLGLEISKVLKRKLDADF